MKTDKDINIKDIKIYSIDYLSNEILTDEDLDYLLSNKYLTYSFIIGMFRYIGDNRPVESLIYLITHDNKWMYNNVWTKRQRNGYEKKLIKCFINIYSYSYIEAKQKAQWWITIYGFNAVKNIINF